MRASTALQYVARGLEGRSACAQCRDSLRPPLERGAACAAARARRCAGAGLQMWIRAAQLSYITWFFVMGCCKGLHVGRHGVPGRAMAVTGRVSNK